MRVTGDCGACVRAREDCASWGEWRVAVANRGVDGGVVFDVWIAEYFLRSEVV
jgi:hypothetical protein